jgi:hypothetical protein
VGGELAGAKRTALGWAAGVEGLLGWSGCGAPRPSAGTCEGRARGGGGVGCPPVAIPGGGSGVWARLAAAWLGARAGEV